MTFEQVLPYFKEGQRIQRLGNVDSLTETIYCKNDNVTVTRLDIPVQDILAKDWMVVQSSFDKVINLLITKKCKTIFRFGNKDNLNKYINYLPSEKRLIIGLGTSSAQDYEFTESDIKAKDWCFK